MARTVKDNVGMKEIATVFEDKYNQQIQSQDIFQKMAKRLLIMQQIDYHY